MAGVWAHVGVTYDAGTSTITLYHNGGAVCDRVLKDGAFGPMTFDEVSGICLGAFPSQVGLGSGAGWTAEASFYTGAMDEIYLYESGVDAGTGDGTVRTGEIAGLDFCIDRKRGPKSGPLF